MDSSLVRNAQLAPPAALVFVRWLHWRPIKWLLLPTFSSTMLWYNFLFVAAFSPALASEMDEIKAPAPNGPPRGRSSPNIKPPKVVSSSISSSTTKLSGYSTGTPQGKAPEPLEELDPHEKHEAEADIRNDEDRSDGPTESSKSSENKQALSPLLVLLCLFLLSRAY